MEQEEKGEGVGWGDVEGEIFAKGVEIPYSVSLHMNTKAARGSSG